MTQPTCGACGGPFSSDDFGDPPTVSLVQIGTTPDGKPILQPQLSKPIRMDPETGAVCWCPTVTEGQP